MMADTLPCMVAQIAPGDTKLNSLNFDSIAELVRLIGHVESTLAEENVTFGTVLNLVSSLPEEKCSRW